MKWSKQYLFTVKEAPADAEIVSHQLMARAGLIKKLAPGIFSYGHLALRSLRKFERIVREELDKRGCQEILMPMVQPASIWQETKRWTEMGEGLLRFKNRNEHEFCLGATHEEVVTDYVRKDVRSYRDLPINLYQIQTKYRDELRPRFGLMRGREFIMKDGYSFDIDRESALKTYALMYEAYQAIFSRVGLNFRIVQADAGNIGGSQTHEFQVLAEAGEDHLMVCDRCDFAANIEVAPVLPPPAVTQQADPLEAFPTPGLKTIRDLSTHLNINENSLVKTLFFALDEIPQAQANGKAFAAVAVLLRGGDELNPVKLKAALGLPNPPRMLTDEEVNQVSGAWPGSCGPVGLTIPVYMDLSVCSLPSLIVGANRDSEHLRRVIWPRDFRPTSIVDLRLAAAGDHCPQCDSGHYHSHRGIEVGHVFYLGAKYSRSMQASFLDPQGQTQFMEMGCYGIGVSRTIQAAVEQNHDKDGIIWPLAIAPYEVHLTVLDPSDPQVASAADKLYADLQALGIGVLMDDREERPGVKFKDADLLGMPLRINLGRRGLESGKLELISRSTKEVLAVEVAQLATLVQSQLAALSSSPTAQVSR